MTTILVLDSSIRPAESSGSRPLTTFLVDQLRALHKDATILHRDLNAEQTPHVSLALFAPPAADGGSTLSSTLTNELIGADIVVIGAPLYNFGIASTLKAWIDHIVIAGKTFRYTENGMPEGLLHDKKVYVVTSRGGVYSQGPMTSFDFVVPYLRTLLGFIGLTDVSVVVAEGLSMGPVAREASMARAQDEITALASAA